MAETFWLPSSSSRYTNMVALIQKLLILFFIFYIVIIKYNSVNCISPKTQIALSKALEWNLPYKYITSLKPIPSVRLAEILKPFSQLNCLTHLTNFQSRDLSLSVDNPMLIRAVSLGYEVIKQKYSVFWVTDSKSFYPRKTPVERLLETNISSDLLVLDFQSSDFDKFCIKINRTLFALKTRMWGCEVEVVVSPFSHHIVVDPGYKIKIMSYPRVWYIKIGCSSHAMKFSPKELFDKKRELAVPIKQFSSMVKLTILYIDNYALKSLSVQPYLKSILSDKFYDSCTTLDAFVVAIANRLNLLNIYLVKLDFLRNLPAFNLMPLQPFVYLNSSRWKNLKLDELVEIEFPDSTVSSAWEIWDVSSTAYKLFRKFEDMFANCQLPGKVSRVWLMAHPTSKIKSETVAFYKLVMNALGNFTFPSGFRSCLNHKKVSISENAARKWDLNLYFESTLGLSPALGLPLLVADVSSSMRFVSCNKLIMQSLQFLEAIRVFDLYTWLTIFLTLCGSAIALTSHSNLGLRNFLSNFCLLISSLIEQGISKNTFSKRFLFLPMFFVLLVVVSNAYKSTNVYNLVAPRRAIVYKTFEQLLEHKFNIYSRHTYAKIIKVQGKIRRDFNRFGQKQVFFDSYIIFNATSEISWLFDMFLAKFLNSSKHVEKLGEISNQTILHPEVQSTYLSKLDEFDVTFGQKDTVLQRIDAIELQVFKKELQICNNLAIILPWYKSFELGKQAQLISEDHQINLGTETLSSYFLGCYFTGMVSPYVRKRFRALSQTGTLEWWSKVLRPLIFRTRSYVPVKAPSMTGNIMILFLILGGGEIASAVLFLCEIVCIILRNAYVSYSRKSSIIVL